MLCHTQLIFADSNNIEEIGSSNGDSPKDALLEEVNNNETPPQDTDTSINTQNSTLSNEEAAKLFADRAMSQDNTFQRKLAQFSQNATYDPNSKDMQEAKEKRKQANIDYNKASEEANEYINKLEQENEEFSLTSSKRPLTPFEQQIQWLRENEDKLKEIDNLKERKKALRNEAAFSKALSIDAQTKAIRNLERKQQEERFKNKSTTDKTELQEKSEDELNNTITETEEENLDSKLEEEQNDSSNSQIYLFILLAVLFGLFIFFNKSSNKKSNGKGDMQLYKQIKTDGIEHASKRFSQILIRDFLTNESLAYEFVLQELDGASQGNNYAQRFVRNSGIPQSEYYGAMSNDCPKSVDDAIFFLLAITLKLQAIDLDFAVLLRTAVVDKIMQYYEFGKYE